MKVARLHLIREKDPSAAGPMPGDVYRFFCPDCRTDVFVIHLEPDFFVLHLKTKPVGDPGVRRRLD